MHPGSITSLLALLCCIAPATAQKINTKKPVKVFILAGQSNMQGQGVVDLDHPKLYNSGRGTLLHVMKDPAKSKQFAHLKDDSGRWVERDDVWIRFQTRDELKRGWAAKFEMHPLYPEAKSVYERLLRECGV